MAEAEAEVEAEAEAKAEAEVKLKTVCAEAAVVGLDWHFHVPFQVGTMRAWRCCKVLPWRQTVQDSQGLCCLPTCPVEVCTGFVRRP